MAWKFEKFKVCSLDGSSECAKRDFVCSGKLKYFTQMIQCRVINCSSGVSCCLLLFRWSHDSESASSWFTGSQATYSSTSYFFLVDVNSLFNFITD